MPELRDTPLICRFSARATPAEVQGILNGIQEKKLQIEIVLHDKYAQDFSIYGHPPGEHKLIQPVKTMPKLEVVK